MRRIRVRGAIQRKEDDNWDFIILLLLLVIGIFSVIEPVQDTQQVDNPKPKVVKSKYHSMLGKINEIRNSKEGLKFCNQTSRVGDCMFRVAKNTQDPGVCEKISEINKADLCYMYFVNERDYSVCEHINSPNIRRSCYSLKTLESLKNSEEISPVNG